MARWSHQETRNHGSDPISALLAASARENRLNFVMAGLAPATQSSKFDIAT